MSRRARFVLRLASLLGVDVHADHGEAHDHLRRVDPLLAAELAAMGQPEPPAGVCPICGQSDQGCSATMDFDHKAAFRDSPKLSLFAFCYGMETPEKALERLWYWLRVKIPQKRTP